MIIQSLNQNDREDKDKLNLYRFKFLVQQYLYDEAIEVGNSLEKNDWTLLYRINLLMALSRNSEARLLVPNKEGAISEAHAIILRNTVLLYSSSNALDNIQKARIRLNQIYSDYREATLLNNEGLVFLRQLKLGDASKLFEQAENLMTACSSKERFQPRLNIGITYALNQNYDLASYFFNLAKQDVPRSLLLDIVKIDLNKTIVDYVNRKLDAAQFEDFVSKAMNQIHAVN